MTKEEINSDKQSGDPISISVMTEEEGGKTSVTGILIFTVAFMIYAVVALLIKIAMVNYDLGP